LRTGSIIPAFSIHVVMAVVTNFASIKKRPDLLFRKTARAK
jgi:hypothetical protein